jgi:hypothetical protein
MADDDFADFERRLAAEQAAGFKDRMENSPPIGAGPDGSVVVYERLEDVPPFEPKIIKP